jgi:hypothetical protein
MKKNKLNAVIPYRSDGREQQLELCLRGLLKHLKDLDQIYVVGDPPHLRLDRVHHLRALDFSEISDINIFYKLLCYSQNHRGRFLKISCDVTLIKPIYGHQLPAYHGHPLFERRFAKKPMHTLTPWENRLLTTARYLQREEGLPEPLDFEVHLPALYHTEVVNKLSRAVKSWDKFPGYVVNSLYFNWALKYERPAVPPLELSRDARTGAMHLERPYRSQDYRNIAAAMRRKWVVAHSRQAFKPKLYNLLNQYL